MTPDLEKSRAHSPGPSGREDFVWSHLQDVANRSAEYAGAFDASEEGRLAGLLHDLGKYGGLFQKRLEGKVHGIDHWSAGARAALVKYEAKGIAAALAVQGHHVGLQKGDSDSLRDLLSKRCPQGLRLSEPDEERLIERLHADGLRLPDLQRACGPVYDQGMPAATMLDVRMLFSALVDADFIETEAHFQARPDGSKGYREEGCPLDPERALAVLLAYIKGLQGSKASPHIDRLRADLLDACLEKASSAPGLFTLTAPTGTGKTLSMLAFALKHAQEHDLRRVVVVIPYLSIIDQTVREFHKVFKRHSGTENIERYVLEDHSLAGTRGGTPRSREKDLDAEDETQRQLRRLAENWDAPIVVTTSVQLLESLFADRSSACRKLHRLAKSVILFDEVQTLPTHLAVPTLATLSRLSERYGSTVVFATATQPAFARFDDAVRKYSTSGWKPREIVPSDLGLFARAKRTRIEWPNPEQSTSWSELAERFVEHEQVLCIVNMKKHALCLFEELRERGAEGLLHLSTNMCPDHRRNVLAAVHDRLERGAPCRLVSTQCVEAGVDLDFPVVFRAFGPLDAVSQAAGRCNRNGHDKIRTVHIFEPEILPQEQSFPDGAYRQAVAVTHILLQEHGVTKMDNIDTPELFEEYYRKLYDLSRPEEQRKELLEAIQALDFVDVAQRYRLIEQDTINVLVPYDRGSFRQLADEVRQGRLTGEWIARARPHTIGLYRPKREDELASYLEPVPLGKDACSEEWFIYLGEDDYKQETGLVLPSSWRCSIA